MSRKLLKGIKQVAESGLSAETGYLYLIEKEEGKGYVQLDGKKYGEGAEELWERGTGENSIQQKGTGAIASGNNSVAEGSGTTASGNYSHAEGERTTASRLSSHAEGNGTTASGTYSHAEGRSTTTSGSNSHAEGWSTTALGICSHAEGSHTTASGNTSHAEGTYTKASGPTSHAEGDHTTTLNGTEHAEGRYNKSNSGTTLAENTQHSVGIGTSTADTKNAFEIMQNGDAYLYGIGGYDGTNPASANTISEVISGINIEVTEIFGPDANGHAYVDLGLPSGTLWATMNVGASAPEGYGGYYAWGETSGKSVYDWSTYAFGNFDSLTKYNETDGKRTLDLEDDAAHVNWGGDWKIPTGAQLDELTANTTSAWTTENGVNGMRFTSAVNGNSIFIPAAGYWWYSSVQGVGEFCLLWSSSLDSANVANAASLYLDETSVIFFDGSSRDSGFSVRGVLTPPFTTVVDTATTINIKDESVNVATKEDLESTQQDLEAAQIAINDRFHFVEGTSSRAGNASSGHYLATKWEASIPGITGATNGLKLAYRIRTNTGVATGGVVLSVDGTNYYPVVIQTNSIVTTHYPVGSTILTVFNAAQTATTYLTENVKTTVTGCWQIMEYDSNSNTIGYQLRTHYSTRPVTDQTGRYRLLFSSPDNTKWIPANTATTTNATAIRDINQRPINPFGEIVYYGYTTVLAADALPTASYLWQQYPLSLGYSFNTGGTALSLTYPGSIYVKCTPQSDGSAIIDATTPIVQALPSTEDGSIYIYLGRAYSAEAIEMVIEHPVYYYKDGEIRVWTNAGEASMVETTWSELKALRDSSGLTPGMQYRITDYQCTTTQTNTQSANHQFDIIVIADDIDTLNENARAIQHSGDTYFSGSTLEAWELKYRLDNDAARFAWADTGATGRGVIYYMKDEWDNECPYDFKNIQFARWEQTNPVGYVFDENEWDYVVDSDQDWVTDYDLKGGFYSSNGSSVDVVLSYNQDVMEYKKKISYTVSPTPTYCYTFGRGLDTSLGEKVYSNIIKEYYISDKLQLNNIVFLQTTLTQNCFSNTFGNNCNSNTFGNECYSNTFGNNCDSNTFGNSCYSNTFGNNCGSNIRGNSNTFGNECYSNTFGDECKSNTFGNECYSNTFGSGCNTNTFGMSCYFNRFGNGCESNAFGDGCFSNTFGNECGNNPFGVGCSLNTFGNGCGTNTFGDYCESNTFGNNCHTNTFGNNCNSNTFGNNCNFNRFGGGCFSNTFGNECGDNPFGVGCSLNTFGNGCGTNTFGDYCESNTFGEKCECIKFGTLSAVKSYCSYNIVENGNRYIYIDVTSTTASNSPYRNVKIAQGVNNTTTDKTITDSNVNQTFRTVYQPANSTTVNI